MNLCALFVARPVATTLLTIAVALFRFFAFLRLAVAPVPQADYPTITVSASMPGTGPDTMAATVATPLERHLGIIADVTEMTSESTVGSTRITLQFSLNRSLHGAARDVQAAINAARADLPVSLLTEPFLSQSQSSRRASCHPGADLAHPDARPDLRRRLENHRACIVADRGRRASPGERQLAPGGGSSSIRWLCRNMASGSRTFARRSPQPMRTAPKVRSKTAVARCRSTPMIGRTTPRIIGRW